VSALIIRGDARALPLPDACVDLVVTSPPYWDLREYRDDGEAYEGQIGSESTPAEYLAHLWEVAAECTRVLKPSGSMFFNLGDKYNSASGPKTGRKSDSLIAQGGGPKWVTSARGREAEQIPEKSLIALPWRFAIGCIDQLGLILRRDQIWHKTNPLPESASDRCPTTHEYLFHLTREPRYYAATDEIREPHAEPNGRSAYGRQRPPNLSGGNCGGNVGVRPDSVFRDMGQHPLGKLPGSVWSIPSEPLTGVPEISPLDGRPLPEHYAAFPSELPRRCILGWSPHGVCVECGEGRRPAVAARYAPTQTTNSPGRLERNGDNRFTQADRPHGRARRVSSIIGYSCACPEPSAPTRPAVILDPFSGTGTTALVADVLGRDGIGVDASHDYCRLARWRVSDPGQRAKAMRVPKPPVQLPGQGSLFASTGGDA
jgi:DNA modification methylase